MSSRLRGRICQNFGFGFSRLRVEFVDFGVRVHSASGRICRFFLRGVPVHPAHVATKFSYPEAP